MNDSTTPPHPFAQDLAMRDKILAGDSELADRFLRNECSDSFGHLIVRYRLEREYSCDDLIHDVYLQWAAENWRALRSWEARCPLSSWAHGAAILLCKNARKKKDGRDRLLDTYSGDALLPGASPDPERSVMDAQLRLLMSQAIEALSKPVERRLFSLHFLDGLTIKEIADKLGDSRGNLDVIKTRAMPRFLAELRKRGVKI